MNDYVLVRHGQTHWNKSGIMHGQYDIPLNDTGRAQARQVAQTLRGRQFDICYSSPLRRARSTAHAILMHHRATPIVFDDRLKELGKGLLEGEHVNSEKMLRGEDAEVLRKYHIESKQEFYERAKAFVRDVESRHSNKRILVVAHSGTIKLLSFVFRPPSVPLHVAYYAMSIKNCVPYKPNDLVPEIEDMKIGFFPMVADVLHAGHVLALEEAKNHCDYLIVGLHCSPSYKEPQQSIYERYMQLRAVKWVDEVIPYESAERDADLFVSLKYDIYFLGEDHKQGDWEHKSAIEGMGRRIIYLNRRHGYSSSRVKNGTK